MQDPDYIHSVRIALFRNNVPDWDRVCIEAMELFGLPGGRYITNIGSDGMDWIFQNQQDALLFKLKFGEVVC